MVFVPKNCYYLSVEGFTPSRKQIEFKWLIRLAERDHSYSDVVPKKLCAETNKESEKLDPGIKDLKFSISGDSAGPSGRKLFISPPVSRYDESNQNRMKDLISLIYDQIVICDMVINF